jgi:hypothetical protein
MRSNVSRGMPSLIFLALLPFFLFLFPSSSCTAEPKDASVSDTVRNKKPDSTAPEKLSVRVLDVMNSRPKNKDRAGLGDKITVKVDKFDELMKLVDNDISRIELKINDNVLQDLRPLRKSDDNALEYQLVSDEKNHAIWDSLGSRSKRIVNPVTVSLALENDADNKKVNFRGYDFKLILNNNTIASILFAVGAILFAVSFLKLGKFDARLRNYGPESSYSLALVQMAVWYYIVTMAFIYLYFTTGCLPELNNSTMILLGISSATAVGAKVIDSSNIDKQSENNKTDSDVIVEQEKAGNSLAKKIEGLKSRHFLYDILSDEYGLALSRFQIFVWTLIMVCIFVYDVLSTAAIPDFSDSNVLTLMGISSGSYIGYKLKEDFTQKINR